MSSLSTSAFKAIKSISTVILDETTQGELFKFF